MLNRRCNSHNAAFWGRRYSSSMSVIQTSTFPTTPSLQRLPMVQPYTALLTMFILSTQLLQYNVLGMWWHDVRWHFFTSGQVMKTNHIIWRSQPGSLPRMILNKLINKYQVRMWWVFRRCFYLNLPQLLFMPRAHYSIHTSVLSRNLRYRACVPVETDLVTKMVHLFMQALYCGGLNCSFVARTVMTGCLKRYRFSTHQC